MRRIRLLSLVLTLCMALGMIALPAYADGVQSDADGNASTTLTITLTIPAAPTKADATKNSVTLAAVDGCEYSKDKTNWQDERTFSGLLPGTAYTFYQRIKETDDNNASPASSATISTLADTYGMTVTLTIKPTPDAPDAPTAASTTKNSVTLTAVDGCEYKLGDGDWQDERTFSGLLPGTAYTFYQRIKETDDNNASPASSATIRTAADTYGMTITLVIKSAQTIAAEDVTATYGDTDKSVSAAVTDPATDGRAISYAVKEGSGDYIEVNEASGALTIKKVPPTDGKAYVTVTAAETDTCTEATKDVTVTISKAQVTVTAKAQTIKEGESIDTAVDQAELKGAVNGHTLSAVTLTVENGKISASEAQIQDAAENDVTGNYAISYAQGDLTVLAKISQTVTFKVVNGSWNDETTADKTVTLTGHEGDTLKLKADQIPAVGDKPADTYKAGALDVMPNTETAITEATAYTYTYSEKSKATVTTAPAAKALTYTGSAQELVTAGEAADGTMAYALGTDETTAPADGWSASIPTATEAGNYYVWYKAVGDENHTDAQAACVAVKITAPDEVTSAGDADFTKDDADSGVKGMDTGSVKDQMEKVAVQDETPVAANQTKEVTVSMEVTAVSEDQISNAEKTGILALMSETDEDQVQSDFLDISVEKTVTLYDVDANGNKTVDSENTTQMTNLGQVVDIPVKYDLTGKKNPVVARYHNGSVQKFTRLSAKPAPGNLEDRTF